eukprot:3880411-Amphidinium_carterae.2
MPSSCHAIALLFCARHCSDATQGSDYAQLFYTASLNKDAEMALALGSLSGRAISSQASRIGTRRREASLPSSSRQKQWTHEFSLA